MAKEIKVHKYYDENDCYVELWKVVGEEKYYGRYTYNNEGTWYYVADPLGYCELDSKVSSDIVFILCDEKGNEYYRYSNGQPNPLPTFNAYIKQMWKKVKDNIPHNTENDEADFWSMCWNGETTRKLNQWLVSFMDKELYPKEIAEMNEYEENWYGCWHNTEIDYTSIPGSEFEFLGSKYQFIKVHHKHDVCGVEWDTFECCDNPIQMSSFGTETHPFIQSYMEMGNWFDDSRYGTMFDKKSARKKVVEKLLEIYPKEKEYQGLLYVKRNEPEKWCIAEAYCWAKSYNDCADMLIDRDYHVEKIHELLDNFEEKVKDKVFINNIDNKEKICNLYPDVYGYDDCLFYYKKKEKILKD